MNLCVWFDKIISKIVFPVLNSSLYLIQFILMETSGSLSACLCFYPPVCLLGISPRSCDFLFTKFRINLLLGLTDELLNPYFQYISLCLLRCTRMWIEFQYNKDHYVHIKSSNGELMITEKNKREHSRTGASSVLGT